MRINREIRAPKIRVIDQNGQQVGIMAVDQALRQAAEAELDLVEVVPNAQPPVCKIIDYGKYRYELAKKEKQGKKTQQIIKVKEVKIKPNIDEHDLEVKLKRARGFLEKGYKVKVSCMFRGREMAHPEIGQGVVKRLCEALEDLGTVEAPMKMMGRFLHTLVAPKSSKS